MTVVNPMTSPEKAALLAKYDDKKAEFDIPWAEAATDVNRVLDVLPESPRNVALRRKYRPEKQTGGVRFFIVEGDMNLLLADVVTIDDDGQPVHVPSPAAVEVAPVELVESATSVEPSPPVDTTVDTADATTVDQPADATQPDNVPDAPQE